MMNNGDNEILDDDLLDNDGKFKRKQRKELKLDYESDSSIEDYQNDNEWPAERERKEESDDIFASDNESGKEEPTDSRNKKPKIELLDIEKFEKEEGIGDYDEEKQRYTESENESDEVPNQEQLDYYNNVENLDDESIGKLKKFKPKIEAFDLREESNEGKFDIEGNYVRNEDNDEDNNEDAWMDNYRKADILKAKKAQEEREKLIQKKRLQKSSNDLIPIGSLLSDLIEYLEPAETPMETLARFRPQKKSKKQRKETNIDDQTRRETVLKITDLCDKLINNKSVDNIYDLSKEELMRMFKLETGEDYNQVKRGLKRSREEEEEKEDEQDVNYGKKVWEFKWLGHDEINGPYSNYEMNHWKEIYFDNNVVVRRIGESEFGPLDSFTFTD